VLDGKRPIADIWTVLERQTFTYRTSAKAIPMRGDELPFIATTQKVKRSDTERQTSKYRLVMVDSLSNV